MEDITVCELNHRVVDVLQKAEETYIINSTKNAKLGTKTKDFLEKKPQTYMLSLTKQ